MNRIEQLRVQKGLQQKDLAIDLSVSQPTISDWESGRKVPSAKSTAKLADYFGVSIDYLLGREDKKKEPATGEGDGLNELSVYFKDWLTGLDRKGFETVQWIQSLSQAEFEAVRAYIDGRRDAQKG